MPKNKPCWIPVHPRRCGERVYVEWLDRYINGSSPQVRGTVVAAAIRPAICRFIPAGAGNG